jgi:hypothetical protein
MGMVPGAGEGDADGEEAPEDVMCGDSRVLFPAAVSPACLKRFKREYLDASFRRTLGTRIGSCSASCPANLCLRELESKGTGRSS